MIIVKKYWLFSGDSYYPAGGFFDFNESFRTIEEAKDYLLKNNSYDWAHIIDIDSAKIVWKKGYKFV